MPALHQSLKVKLPCLASAALPLSCSLTSNVAILPLQVAEESGTDLAQALLKRLRQQEKQASNQAKTGDLHSDQPQGSCSSLCSPQEAKHQR